MSIVGILIVVLGIGLSIALHEVGHMWPAKKFGVKVTQFMVGFGPTLFSRRKGDTEYGVKLIPLGGYVRMIGMFPPRPEGARRDGRFRQLIENARAETLSEVQPEDEHRVFWRLKTWQKIIVMAGGPTVNLILSAVFLGAIFHVIGISQPSFTVDTVVQCVPTVANPSGSASIIDSKSSCPGTQPTPAALMGLKSGDRMVAVNGTKYDDRYEFGAALAGLKNAPLTLTVVRDGQQLDLRGTTTTIERPVYDDQGQDTGKKQQSGFIGFRTTVDHVKQEPTAVPRTLWMMSVDSVKALGSFPVMIYDLARTLVTGQERDINGPVSVVGVADIGGQMAASGEPWRDVAVNLLGLLASLNLFLFLFNLVPLPPLDGGHVAGALVEGVKRTIGRIRGRQTAPVDTAAMLPIAYVAVAVLLVMSLVVIVADIFKPLQIPG
jgi:membrane-associated protease RseP (regulator of RpoE activity)